jgi:hypothetical protein
MPAAAIIAPITQRRDLRINPALHSTAGRRECEKAEGGETVSDSVHATLGPF